MRSFSIILTLTFLFYGCKQSESPKAQDNKIDSDKSFEGVVEYKVKFRQKTDTLDSYIYDYLSQKYGSKEMRYFAETGEFKSVYPESGDYGVEFYLYKKDSNTQFYASKSTDTIYYFDVEMNNFTFISENEEPDEIINGETCNCFSFSLLDESFNQPLKMKYCYSGSPYLDINLFKDYKDSFYEKAISKSNSIFRKIVYEFNDYSYTFEIENFERKNIKKSIFKLPKNRPFRKY